CLVNVDVFGSPVPSARFMGGREAEIMGGIDRFAVVENYDPQALLVRLPRLLADDVCAIPSFVPGVGPFPSAHGKWHNKPSDPRDQRAMTDLYLALMADAVLELIGSRASLLIEGRFGEADVFTRALATLRAQQKVFVSLTHQDVTYGALRLAHPCLSPASRLVPVAPLDIDLGSYAAQWRARAQAVQVIA
ncbi:MAG: carbohydrate kinase, partial [Steroidobacteraceae bacterium]